ncbi:hypothetical protein LP420_27695 [Massilia sp. B-10]|nr:hypothetical protein LP420_27695 [Massilia sp. B-10]
MPGQIELRLTGQRLELSQAFRQRMATLFPGDPLPEIFTPPDQIKTSTAVLPLDVRVHYGLGPLVALMAAALALLGGAVTAALALARPRKALVTVEDELRTMHARFRHRAADLRQGLSNKVAQLKTTVFGHQLIDLREGAQVQAGPLRHPITTRKDPMQNTTSPAADPGFKLPGDKEAVAEAARAASG